MQSTRSQQAVKTIPGCARQQTGPQRECGQHEPCQRDGSQSHTAASREGHYFSLSRPPSVGCVDWLLARQQSKLRHRHAHSGQHCSIVKSNMSCPTVCVYVSMCCSITAPLICSSTTLKNAYLQDLPRGAVVLHEPGQGVIFHGLFLEEASSLRSLFATVHKDEHLMLAGSLQTLRGGDWW